MPDEPIISMGWQEDAFFAIRNRLEKRIEELEGALRKVTDYFASTPATMTTGMWEALSEARAALAAGEEKP